MAVPGTITKTSQDWRWPRQFLRETHGGTAVFLPDDLSQTRKDRLNVLFNELGAKDARDWQVVGNEESVKQTYTAGVYLQMYGIIHHETVVVCISDANKRGQLLSVSHPVRRENTSSHYVQPGARVKYRAAASCWTVMLFADFTGGSRMDDGRWPLWYRRWYIGKTWSSCTNSCWVILGRYFRHVLDLIFALRQWLLIWWVIRFGARASASVWPRVGGALGPVGPIWVVLSDGRGGRTLGQPTKARSHTHTQAQATQPLHRGPPTSIIIAFQQVMGPEPGLWQEQDVPAGVAAVAASAKKTRSRWFKDVPIKAHGSARSGTTTRRHRGRRRCRHGRHQDLQVYGDELPRVCDGRGSSSWKERGP